MSVFSECIDNIQLVRTDSFASFFFASFLCVGEGSELAVPVDAAFFDRIQQIASQRPDQAWIGLSDPFNIGGAVTDRFLSVPDQVLLDFTNSGFSNFPWQNGQPDDSGNDEDCVAIEGSELVNFECSRIFEVICQLPCVEEGQPEPTPSPTESPTNFPTQSKTDLPTQSPTKQPSKFPSESPTPTQIPSNIISETPTKEPTKAPLNFINVPTISPISTNILEEEDSFNIFEIIIFLNILLIFVLFLLLLIKYKQINNISKIITYT